MNTEIDFQSARDALIGKSVPAEYVSLFRHSTLRELAIKHNDADAFGKICLNYACCSGDRHAIKLIWGRLLEWGEVQGSLL